MGATGTLRQALMYLIDETVNNVLHHSEDDKGYNIYTDKQNVVTALPENVFRQGAK